MIVEFACECGCGGVPREEDVEIGLRTGRGEVIALGQHWPGHAYAMPKPPEEWVARHPGGQWVPLVPLDKEAAG